MKTILITGGAGFIGSNFIEYFLKKYPSYHIVNLDALTYAGNLDNLNFTQNYRNYDFIHGNICDQALLVDLFEKYHFDALIHFAAESHVDNSISSPNTFIETNIRGTFTLLEVAKSFWIQKPFQAKNGIFHHISTDEVYGSLGERGLFSENTPYAPNSPYSASKASSDMLVRSYHHTYGLQTLISNCSNNYGPKQHSEKLIPTIIAKALANKAIPIYGDGLNIRDWLYVEDHCRGIDLVFHSKEYGESYNIGGNNEHTNIAIARKICSILDELLPRKEGSYHKLLSYVADRAGHDKRYAIDASKIHSKLNWHPQHSFEEGIRKTVEWYISKWGFKNSRHPRKV